MERRQSISIEQERKSTVKTGLAQVHTGDQSVPSWDACIELRWAEICRPPLLPCMFENLDLVQEGCTGTHTHHNQLDRSVPNDVGCRFDLNDIAQVCQGRVRGGLSSCQGRQRNQWAGYKVFQDPSPSQLKDAPTSYPAVPPTTQAMGHGFFRRPRPVKCTVASAVCKECGKLRRPGSHDQMRNAF